MQYQVSVQISSDICTLVTGLLSLCFNHFIFIASYIINTDISSAVKIENFNGKKLIFLIFCSKH